MKIPTIFGWTITHRGYLDHLERVEDLVVDLVRDAMPPPEPGSDTYQQRVSGNTLQSLADEIGRPLPTPIEWFS